MAVWMDGWKSGHMAVMTAYFDASGSPSVEAVALGGLVTTPERWLEFDHKWSECLSAFDVTALHMKDFAHSLREFRGWDMDQPKRRRLLNGLLWVIEEMIEYTAASAVYIDDYNSLDRDYKLSEAMRPYTMASLSCAGHIVPWAKNHNVERIAWIFEKGDVDQDDLRKHWETTYPELEVAPIFLKKRDRYPDPSQCRFIRAFEAADLLAYENLQAHKLVMRNVDVEFGDLRKPMQRMISLPGFHDWGMFNSEDIRSVCEGWKIPTR